MDWVRSARRGAASHLHLVAGHIPKLDPAVIIKNGMFYSVAAGVCCYCWCCQVGSELSDCQNIADGRGSRVVLHRQPHVWFCQTVRLQENGGLKLIQVQDSAATL